MSPPSARMLYRHTLRHLPPISRSLGPLHQSLRASFSADSVKPITPEAAQQLLTYLQSQRMYATLLERYNPGLAGELDVQEHVRRTANRVGLDLSGMERGGNGQG